MEFGKCIGILGKSGSGKSSVASMLKSLYNLNEVVLYTTRPIRKGEQHGKDYYYTTKEEFLRKKEEGFFVETRVYHTIYGDWYYGSCLKDYTNNSIVVLSPEMYILLRDNPKINLYTVYINVDDDSLFDMLHKRGDEKAEIDRRLTSDADCLSDSLIKELNLVIDNFHYQRSPRVLAEIIAKECLRKNVLVS